MSYRVIWDSAGENDLRALWHTTADLDELERALLRLDTALAADPLKVGESRAVNRRIGFEANLVYEFTVDKPNRTVIISAIWRHK